VESLPTIEISLQDFTGLVGKQLSLGEVQDLLFGLKCEVAESKEDRLTLDVLADRPDLLSVEGVAREVRGILGLEEGLAKYELALGQVSVTVDHSAVKVRPFIACGVVRGVSLDDESLRQAMQLQEKLHVTYCRKRRAASIGIYDLDTVSPTIRYTALKPDEIRFQPLEIPTPLSGTEILKETDQGQDYGGILSNFEKYPILVDDKGVVLSMPPIVNSEETKVNLHSRNLLVDVTGISGRLVNQVLNILVCGLAERGGKLESVKIGYPESKTSTPRLEPLIMRLRRSYANSSLGIGLTASQIAKYLRRMRFGANASQPTSLTIRVPAYRVDVLGEIDLVEDLAIAFGYGKLVPTLPTGYTIGNELQRTRVSRLVREAMVGLGFQEVLSFTLSNPRIQYEMMGMKPVPHVEIQNPMSQEYSSLRTSLLPGILKFLSENKHVSLPHRVFECGDVVIPDESEETFVRSDRRIVAAIADNEVGYEDIQAVLYAFLHEFGAEFQLERSTHPSLLTGRTGEVKIDGDVVGLVGEVNPTILLGYELETPTAVLELNVDGLAQLICRAK
jgi:phenylalanyl-tRNA synthetase beta chain